MHVPGCTQKTIQWLISSTDVKTIKDINCTEITFIVFRRAKFAFEEKKPFNCLCNIDEDTSV
jgi:hypothetical protein